MNGPIVPIIRGPGNVILEQLSAIPVGTTALAVEHDSDTRGRIVPFDALSANQIGQAIDQRIADATELPDLTLLFENGLI